MAITNGRFTGEIEGKNIFSYSNKLDYNIEDLEKRKALQKARKLEQDYEHQLSSKIGEITADTQKQGVDYDE